MRGIISTNAQVGDVFVVSGKPYVVVRDAATDGQPGLWWVCDRDDPNAQLILRDGDFLNSGVKNPPTKYVT